jgi:hypothetical protein
MAKGKRHTLPLGTMTGDFDPFHFREDLFRVAVGDSKPQPENGYPVLEMLRYAKLAFDQNRRKIPKGHVQKFNDRITSALQNAGLVEVHHQAELRLMNRLLQNKSISERAYNQEMAYIEELHSMRIKEAARSAAEWLAKVEHAISNRKVGGQEKKILPDEADIRDWQVVLAASSVVRPPFDKDGPLGQCLALIPEAVRQACECGHLQANTHEDVVAAGKQFEAHIKRIRFKAKKWMGQTD